MLESKLVSEESVWEVMEIYQSINNEHSTRLVIMSSSSNDIPQLSLRAITSSDLNRIQICPEITRQLIDKKALAI
jgi:hypothetical protein